MAVAQCCVNVEELFRYAGHAMNKLIITFIQRLDSVHYALPFKFSYDI